jgi:ribose transport system substrate-binding protein
VSRGPLNVKAAVRPARRWAVSAIAVAATLIVAACGGTSESDNRDSTSTGSSRPGSKLIVAGLSYPCGLNDYARHLCAGFAAGQKQLPPGFRFKLTTGVDFADQTAFNNLIQTSLQLKPAGVIVFPDGPAAQVPVLKQACAKNVRIIIIDNPVTGLGKCQSTFIGPNNYQLGAQTAEWLIRHPPLSKEVGVVSLPPGATASTDERVKGFTKTIEAAGYRVVASVSTDLTLAKTRTQVTNMLTAHPKLSAIFSSGDQMGYGTAQAVKNNPGIKQLTIDGALDAVKRIPRGLSADVAQHPFWLGEQSVLYMAKVLQGQTVPQFIPEPTKVIDESNVKAYLEAGGLR